ncbi:serine hydrolase [Opitutus terrae]|uniref:Beta-lactamase n=1 Tax=Opitutus terrae (strain DSM 11246 / JCM 15787 / PB90-1) TaxID=452637 RepID=B1ZXW2_OPITP|nr:serine hydrolase [Opitutus terrae]ACB75164.1 beta-lactamase [Opitutus terrae PB90-1]
MHPLSLFQPRHPRAFPVWLCLVALAGVSRAPCAAALATDAAAPLPLGSARDLGFAPDRLDRLHANLRQLVDEGRCSGFVTLLVRHGQIADWRTYGWRDLETRAPMEQDTIFRIASNSKLITSVGAMILFEEGRLDLDAPIATYLPDFKDVRVLTGGTVDAPELVEPKTPPRIRHLLSHTAGFTYDFGDTDVLSQLYRRHNPWAAASLDEFVARAAKLPLAHEPGAAFRYGISTDVLGAIIERVSGQNLEEFLQARLFRPLRMVDTSFDVPAEKLPRLASVYRRQGDQLVNDEPGQADVARRRQGIRSGGGGLFSTTGDYARFAQMLLNGGELDGVRILGRKTVEYMTLNHLARTSKPTHAYSDSRGFGLGAEVVIDPAKDPTLCSLGQFGWSGSNTTRCQIDPREDLVALVFLQHRPMNETGVFARFANGYNLALTNPPRPMTTPQLPPDSPGLIESGQAPSRDYAAVKHCIEQAIGWAIEKDFDAMFHLWGDDLFHFWVFSNSTVIGLDAFKRYADQWRDPDFRGTRFEFRDLRIRFSRSGDVAWYSTYLDDCATIKGKEHCLQNVFQTGVLEKRDGRWVHVQMHGSYPVDRIPENLLQQFYADQFSRGKTE